MLLNHLKPFNFIKASTRIFILVNSVLIFGCSGGGSDTPASDQSSSTLDCATSASATSSFCINKTSGRFIYSQQYGGRFSASTTVVVASGTGQITIPTGWYETGATVSFTDSNLSAANVKASVNIFGTSGSFATTATSACSTVSGGGLLGSNCSAAPSLFYYSSQYGGRSSECTNVGTAATNTQPCWVNYSGSFKVTTSLPPEAAPYCSVQGYQGTLCRGQTNEYRYTTAFGGRSALCNLGFNSNACWWDQTGYYISSSPGNNCTDNSLNAASCATQPSRYVYTTELGGRNVACTNNNSGNCFVEQVSKQALEPNLISGNIIRGASIFGIVGSFSGDGDWASGAHRDIDAVQIGAATEAGNYAGKPLPFGFRSVPKISLDDDGRDSSNNNIEYVNRTGWDTTSCGLAQSSIDARIADCGNVFGTNAVWNGSTQGNSSQGVWKLVTRVGAKVGIKGREVWRDERTKLLWSSIVASAVNWCRATGSSNASSVAASDKESDPNGICNNSTYQTQTTAESICFEKTGFVLPTTNDVNSKGNLSLSSTPKVAWRAPTLYDYDVADYNGIRFVLPDMGQSGSSDEWTATTYSIDTKSAWTFNGSQGEAKTKIRSSNSVVRCVGR